MNRLATLVSLVALSFAASASQSHAEVTLVVSHYTGELSLVSEGATINGIRITSPSGLLDAGLGAADPFSTFFDRRPTEIVMGNLSTFVEIDGVVPLSPRTRIFDPFFDLTFQYGVGVPPLGDLVDGEIRVVPEPSTTWLLSTAAIFMAHRNRRRLVRSR